MNRPPLYEMHRQAGAEFTDFAGYEMPLQYSQGTSAEQTHTREAASLFDISHMGQIEVSGPRVQEEMELLLPLQLDKVSLSHLASTSFLSKTGEVISDVIITRRNRDNFVLVVGAESKDQVIRYLTQQLQYSPIHILNDYVLFAVQGPQALSVLLQLFPSEVGNLSLMEGMLVKFQQIECFISRVGSMGEDCFEISVPVDRAEKIAKALLQKKPLRWAGLAAHNSCLAKS